MDIIIPLPQYSSASTYKELEGYLKQLELAIHHAQKSVESAERSGIELSEDTFVVFEHPGLESSLRLDEQKDGLPKTADNFLDNYYEELQNVELKIHLK